MSNLANQLVVAEQEEVSRGIRLLLATPLISERTAAESFDLVRRRRVPIAKWFDYYCGWSLVVEPRFGYARLAKVRSEPDDTRPARRLRSGKAPFDRRRYTLLCVVAAELVSVPYTTIGFLADRVTQATATDAALPTFDTASRGERMAYVDVLRLLENYGAIEVVDGSTESYVDSESAKVLYRVDATLLMRLLSAPGGPSQLAVPAEDIASSFEDLLNGLVAESRYGDTTDADTGGSDVRHNLWLRHSIFRKLVDDPVLYFAELSQAELAYLRSPTGSQLPRKAAEQAGFLLEERAEGMLLVDPDALATDSKFPDDASHAKVAALMLLDAIRGVDGGVTREQLHTEAAALLRKFPRWAKSYQGEDGALRLVSEALTVLGQFGLVRAGDDVVTALPAAARYAVTIAEQESKK